MAWETNKYQDIANLANTIAGIATGAGIPLIQLGVTIASNFAKGKEITLEDIQGSKEKALNSLADLKNAINADTTINTTIATAEDFQNYLNNLHKR